MTTLAHCRCGLPGELVARPVSIGGWWCTCGNPRCTMAGGATEQQAADAWNALQARRERKNA